MITCSDFNGSFHYVLYSYSAQMYSETSIIRPNLCKLATLSKPAIPSSPRRLSTYWNGPVYSGNLSKPTNVSWYQDGRIMEVSLYSYTTYYCKQMINDSVSHIIILTALSPNRAHILCSLLLTSLPVKRLLLKWLPCTIGWRKFFPVSDSRGNSTWSSSVVLHLKNMEESCLYYTILPNFNDIYGKKKIF
jgi:hypothetical protein